MARDYRSPYDMNQPTAQSGFDSVQKLSEMLQKGNLQTQHEKAAKDNIELQHQLKEEGAKSRMLQVEQLHKQYPNMPISMTAEGASMGSSADELLKMLQFQALNQDREDRKLERLQDDVTKSGAPQAVESMKRVNQAIPGAYSGQAKFKSVGGVKNLAPNFAVPVLEKLGVMDKGASDERAALQEAQNAKIYDSSGKQINEAEMQRIKDSMGLRGMFDPSAVNEALKQIGQTVQAKSQNITGGYKPSTVQRFNQQGGVTPDSIKPLLQPQQAPAPVNPQQPATNSDAELQELEMLRKKHKR